MLTAIDTPPHLAELHEQARAVAATLRGAFELLGEPAQLQVGAVLESAYPGHVVYVLDGVMRHGSAESFVRFYGDDDLCVLPPQTSAAPAWPDAPRTVCDFACELLVIPTSEWIAYLADAPAEAGAWAGHRELQLRLMQGLCAAFAPATSRPRFELRRFAAGDVIVKQGTAADELYVLMYGRAVADVDGRVVGAVTPGEAFGEMAFLTGERRNATVVADEPTMVQVIGHEDFRKLARGNPEFLMEMLRTHARRLAAANLHLVAA